MESIGAEMIVLLSFLLPGFVTAAIFYSLTAHPKASQFERVIQALIFTIVVQGVVVAVQRLLYVAFQMQTDDDGRLVLSLVAAVVVGLAFSWWSNNDTIHAFLRRTGFTSQTSFPSEWFGAFNRKDTTYVVLHLSGNRRIYGWPEEWPSDPSRGHFRIVNAEWLDDARRLPLTGVSGILIPVSEVSFVEFMAPLDAQTQRPGSNHG